MLTRLEKTLQNIKALIKTEFQKSIDNYWLNLAKRIDHKDPSKFFPSINRIFRRKKPSSIDQLYIPTSEAAILLRAKNNQLNTPIINNNFLIDDSTDIMNWMGAYYETINASRFLNENTQHKSDIDTIANNIKSSPINCKSNHSYITTFSPNNLASAPSWNGSISDNWSPFYNDILINIIFSKLPNKVSNGPDSIPPIVLKNLPDNMIIHFTMLFNNLINQYYFPPDWKTANVLPFIKKDKNLHLPASHRPISLTVSVKYLKN